jgi:hypothetical protein
MAQVDVQWPSEDEDFDAITGAATTKVTESNEPEKSKAAVESNQPSLSEEPAEPAESTEPTPKPAEPETTPELTANEPETPSAPADEPQAAPAVTVASPKSEAKSSKLHLLIEAVLLIAVIVLGAWSWGLMSDRDDLKRQVAQLNSNPQIAVQKQTDQLIAAVGKLMDLPKGETPTIANVSDAAQAKKQSAFFNNAQNGDKVLMYVKAGEAILYRPSTDRIILVAPLTFNNNATTTPPTTSSTTKR